MESKSQKVDVRIIVSGPDFAEIVSKSIKKMKLEADYNIMVTSIIPTTDVNIAAKVAKGADIILVGSYGEDENFNLLYNELKTEFNHIGLFNYNKIVIEDESIDESLTKQEIFNSIIKSGLSYSLNIINIHSLENRLDSLNKEYHKLKSNYEKITQENTALTVENNSQSEIISNLNDTIDELKSDFSAFKLRYQDISSKEILEIYPIKTLWEDTFNEELTEMDKILIASEKFKPEKIIVGQGLIGAQSKEDAVDWLKVIKTALIFLENTEDELKQEFNEIEDITEVSEKNDDYEIPNAFENFWE